MLALLDHAWLLLALPTVAAWILIAVAVYLLTRWHYERRLRAIIRAVRRQIQTDQSDQAGLASSQD